MARGKRRVFESADTVEAGMVGAATVSAADSGVADAPESGDRAATHDFEGTEPAPPPGAHLDVAIGDRVGRYLVLAPLGRGGMSRVYRAFDPKLDRQVALKVVAPGRGDGWSVADERTRLVREAQAIAKLTHPN